MLDYASFIESLQIPAASLIAAGTLCLPAVLASSFHTLDDVVWYKYSPGDLMDPPEVVLRLAKEESRSSANAGRSPKTGLKRKRGSSEAPGPNARAPGMSLAEETRLPSIDELDRLASQAFIKLEYAISGVDGSTGTLQALFRVFLIPMDAPGVNARTIKSKLRIRSSAVKAYAQRTLARIFHHMRYDIFEWSSGELQPDTQPLLAHVQNPSSLMDVYNKLEDPSPKALQGLKPEGASILEDILREDAPEGMYSRLYDFQKTCLWTLAARELAPQRYVDLTYRPFTSVDSWGTLYFLDANSFVWSIAPTYEQPKSAIVSEGMGTGKTCICLALVLTTRHQLAKVDFDHATLGVITTARTEHSEAFPWHEDEASNVFGSTNSSPHPIAPAMANERSTLPSLFDLTLDLLHCSQHSKVLTLDSRLHEPSDADLPYLWEIPPSKGRDDTRSESRQKKQVFVSAATLVIVPDILVAQWLAEIAKHVKDDALDYIKIEKGDEVPDERKLCKLDLVLVSESKVRSEESRFWSQSVPICRCPYLKNTRTIDCRCKKVVDRGASPLVGVYWRRLIVDEGHKVAGHGDLVRLCMRLRTESRFVVSGTPSKNLVGANDVPTSGHGASASAEADKSDFERLANIAAFMGLHPFATESNTQLFLKAFHEPYRLRGDTSAIQAFLAASVVRHNVPDLALPPLYRDVVTLEFNPLERITYNALLALFASNSVLSERQDEDYFFHPKQRGPLNTLVSNLGAAHLLFSSPELVKSLIHARNANAKAFEMDLNKTQKGQNGYPLADQRLLADAQAHLQKALLHPLWKKAQSGSMVYSVAGLSSQLVEAWSGTVTYDRAGQVSIGPSYMPGEKVSSLRYQIGRQAASDTDWLTKSDEEFIEELITWSEREARRILEEQLAASKPRVKGEPSPKRTKRGDGEAHSARRAATGAFNKGTGREKQRLDFRGLPMASDLPFAELPAIASTKVAYVLESIRAHPEEKFLVFSGGSSSSAQVSANNLYYLAEALDLANIPHLIFVRSLSQEKLAAYAKAFSESSVFRVLLLDLKFAARGLTLSKATRIIFTEPVWHMDEEAQAVKRAHRLGQDKPVFVETLVMRDSFEERVLNRRSQLSRQETGNAKMPHEDSQLYDALKSMSFLPDAVEDGLDESPLTALAKPLRLIPEALEEEQAAEIDAVLAQFKRETAVELQELASSNSRQGSRSRSSTPALIRATSSPETPSTSDAKPPILLKSALKAAAAAVLSVTHPEAPPVNGKAGFAPVPLMSRARTNESSDDDDDHVFVVTSTRAPVARAPPGAEAATKPKAKKRKVAFAD